MSKHRKYLWFSEVSYNVQAQERLVIQRSELQCTSTGKTCDSAKSATMSKHRKYLWFSEVSCNVQAQERLVIQRSQLQCPSTGKTCDSAKSATMSKHRKDSWFSEVSYNVQAQERLVIQRSQLQCPSTGNTEGRKGRCRMCRCNKREGGPKKLDKKHQGGHANTRWPRTWQNIKVVGTWR